MGRVAGPRRVRCRPTMLPAFSRLFTNHASASSRPRRCFSGRCGKRLRQRGRRELPPLEPHVRPRRDEAQCREGEPADRFHHRRGDERLCVRRFFSVEPAPSNRASGASVLPSRQHVAPERAPDSLRGHFSAARPKIRGRCVRIEEFASAQGYADRCKNERNACTLHAGFFPVRSAQRMRIAT